MRPRPPKTYETETGTYQVSSRSRFRAISKIPKLSAHAEQNTLKMDFTLVVVIVVVVVYCIMRKQRGNDSTLVW